MQREKKFQQAVNLLTALLPLELQSMLPFLMSKARKNTKQERNWLQIDFISKTYTFFV